MKKYIDWHNDAENEYGSPQPIAQVNLDVNSSEGGIAPTSVDAEMAHLI